PALRPRARTVRQADRRAPEHRQHARRHADPAECGASADSACRAAEERRPAVPVRSLPGQAVRLGNGGEGLFAGGADPRRLRLSRGLSGRALLPRCPYHADLRGLERDPAPADRAGVGELHTVSATACWTNALLRSDSSAFAIEACFPAAAPA